VRQAPINYVALAIAQELDRRDLQQRRSESRIVTSASHGVDDSVDGTQAHVSSVSGDDNAAARSMNPGWTSVGRCSIGSPHPPADEQHDDDVESAPEGISCENCGKSDLLNSFWVLLSV